MLRLIVYNIRIGVYYKTIIILQKELFHDYYYDEPAVYYIRRSLKKYCPTLKLNIRGCSFKILQYKNFRSYSDILFYDSKPCIEQWHIIEILRYYCLYAKESFYAAQVECHEHTGKFNLML